MYIERQREFEIVFRDEIIPFFRGLKMTFERISEGDKELIDNIFESIDFDVREFNNFCDLMINR